MKIYNTQLIQLLCNFSARYRLPFLTDFIMPHSSLSSQSPGDGKRSSADSLRYPSARKERQDIILSLAMLSPELEIPGHLRPLWIRA